MTLPQIVTYVVGKKGMKNKGEHLKEALVEHDAGIGAAAVGKKAHFKMK